MRIRSGEFDASAAGDSWDFASRGAPGSSTVNVAPAPGLDSRVMRPPCSVTMPWQIESPSPVPSPSDLVVKNGSKTRAAISSEMPGPSSATVTATPSSHLRAVIRTCPLRPVAAIACAALFTRFTNT